MYPSTQRQRLYIMSLISQGRTRKWGVGAVVGGRDRQAVDEDMMQSRQGV